MNIIMEQTIYTINSKYTLEEVLRYNRFILINMYHLKRQHYLCYAVSFLILCGIIASDITSYIDHHTYPITSIITFLVLGYVNWNLHTSPDRKAKEAYNKNTLIKDAPYSLYFYDTYFVSVVNGDMSKSKFQYNRLSEIIETKTNYYVMTVWNNGIIIRKSDCPQGFDNFINGIKATYHL